MNRSYKYEITGVVESIKDNVTLRRDVVGKEITFLVNDVKSILFLEDNDVNYEFIIGKTYSLKTYDNFIVEVEESNHE